MYIMFIGKQHWATLYNAIVIYVITHTYTNTKHTKYFVYIVYCVINTIYVTRQMPRWILQFIFTEQNKKVNNFAKNLWIQFLTVYPLAFGYSTTIATPRHFGLGSVSVFNPFVLINSIVFE